MTARLDTGPGASSYPDVPSLECATLPCRNHEPSYGYISDENLNLLAFFHFLTPFFQNSGKIPGASPVAGTLMFPRALVHPLSSHKSFFLLGPRGTGKTTW